VASEAERQVSEGQARSGGKTGNRNESLVCRREDPEADRRGYECFGTTSAYIFEIYKKVSLKKQLAIYYIRFIA
jgi:hypothetical protein